MRADQIAELRASCGWHHTAAIGVFGATAAVGKLIGLTPEQMLNAFGIAYSHAAGNPNAF
jgi:2-methylcitrate dehydratase PrpD